MQLLKDSKPQRPVKKIGPVVLYVVAFVVASVAVRGLIGWLNDDKPSSSKLSTSTESKEFVSTEYGFKAMFPGLPTTERQNVAVQGYNLTQTFYSKVIGGDKYYAIAAIDYPAEFDMSDTKARLEGALNGSAQNISDGQLLSSSFTKFGTYDAIDGTITGTQSGEPVTVRARNILVGQRLYTILVIGVTESEYNSFRDSFQLL